MHKKILLGIMVFLFLVAIIPPIGATSITTNADYAKFYIGDTITISGKNTASQITYISACTAGSTDCEHGTAPVNADGSWTYTFKTPFGFGVQTVNLWTDVNQTPGFPDKKWNMMMTNRPTSSGQTAPDITKTTPTTEPTPNYKEQISAIKTQIAEIQTNVSANQATIATLAATKAPTPRPTAKVNYSATMEKLQKELDVEQAKNKEQDNWIHQILSFFGIAS